MLSLYLLYFFGSSSLVLDPSHPGRASVSAMVSSHFRKLAGTASSIRDSWDALQFTTLHCLVSLTKTRIFSSPPWYLGYAPTQPDPPQSPACFLPRVSVVTTTWSNLVAAATNNTSTQTSSRRPLGVKDRRCWLSHYRSISTRSVSLRGNPLTISPPFNYIHQPYHPSSIPSTPSGLARVRPLPLRKSFRQAMPHVTSTTADQRSEPAFFISPNRNCSLTRRCTEPDAPIYITGLVSIVGGNPLRHPVLSHLFVNLASDVGGNPLRRPVTSYLSVYLASDVGGNPLRHTVQSHQKLVRTCRHTILTSSYVLENISLPCLLSMNGEKFRILFRALVSVYSPVCYLVERSVRGLKVQSRILGFFSLVRTVSRRYL
uniref:Uncharacterized protein n=1 Tax=Brassica campestris TaxID=3711 RepID=M4DVK9_BRACM